jgi:DNA modification methylase
MILPSKGKHMLYEADSSAAEFDGGFDLVICSPPYFNPSRSSSNHGVSPEFRDLDSYADWTARILVRCAASLKPGQALCFVKTNVKYKRTLLPVGFRVVEHCRHLGLPLQAHWVWRRIAYFSPYAPSFSNIFVLGTAHAELLRHAGLFETRESASRDYPGSFTPNLFEELIRRLTGPDETVLDPFLGLGSVVLAASRSGRWCVGVELSGSRQLSRAAHALRDVPAVCFNWQKGRPRTEGQ